MKIELYVKQTSNSEGLGLQTFERLSPEWTGASLDIPFGEEGRVLEVVGWTDLFTGRPCAVHVARVKWLARERPDISGGPPAAVTGILVWGGNSGVRILDEECEPIPGLNEHLPRGWGRPIIWVEEMADLPLEVQRVIDGNLED